MQVSFSCESICIGTIGESVISHTYHIYMLENATSIDCEYKVNFLICAKVECKSQYGVGQ